MRAGGSVGRGRSFLSELSRGEPTSNLDNNTLRNLIYLLLIASTDVTGLMHWVIKMVCDHPEWIQKLRDDPEPGEVARRIVRETLRLEQSEYLIRQTRQTIRATSYGLCESACARAITAATSLKIPRSLTPTASSASALRRAVNTLLWACPGSPASASS